MTNDTCPRFFGRLLCEGTPRYVTFASEGEALALLDAAPWHEGRPTGETLTVEHPRWLCPVDPSKIIGIGRNYRAHAAELDNAVPEEPLMFLKPPSSLLGPEGSVELPPESSRVDYEGELALVIARRCRRVPPGEAMSHVFGYVPACDVTARDLQRKDKTWTRGKGLDTFCPIGPLVTTGVDPAALRLQLLVNEQPRQDGNTRDMIFDVATLVSYASQSMTLEAGDVILTGTPEGVGPLADGDRVRVAIEGLDPLAFSVAKPR